MKTKRTRTAGSTLAMLLTIIALVHQAWAASPEKSNDDMAKKFFAKAKSYYQEKNYQACADAFLAAYAAAPYPELLYDAGVCYDKAGKADKAITYYSLYLAARPNDKDAIKIKRKIENLVRQQRKKLAPRQQQHSATTTENTGLQQQRAELYQCLAAAAPYEVLDCYGGTSWKNGVAGQAPAAGITMKDILEEIKNYLQQQPPAGPDYPADKESIFMEERLPLPEETGFIPDEYPPEPPYGDDQNIYPPEYPEPAPGEPPYDEVPPEAVYPPPDEPYPSTVEEYYPPDAGDTYPPPEDLPPPPEGEYPPDEVIIVPPPAPGEEEYPPGEDYPPAPEEIYPPDSPPPPPFPAPGDDYNPPAYDPAGKKPPLTPPPTSPKLFPGEELPPPPPDEPAERTPQSRGASKSRPHHRGSTRQERDGNPASSQNRGNARGSLLSWQEYCLLMNKLTMVHCEKFGEDKSTIPQMGKCVDQLMTTFSRCMFDPDQSLDWPPYDAEDCNRFIDEPETLEACRQHRLEKLLP